jgi:ABC-type spermidine/putrescine transport system permease subunit I
MNNISLFSKNKGEVSNIWTSFVRRRDLGTMPAILFMAFCAVIPIIFVLIMSFYQKEGLWMGPPMTFANYEKIMSTDRLPIILRTARIAAITTGVSLLIAMPAAFFFAKIASLRAKAILLAAFTVPFIVSPLIRMFALRAMLGRTGIVNLIVMGLGLSKEPLGWLLFTDFSIYLGLLASYLPFCIFPIWLALEGIDNRLFEASADLGGKVWQTFWFVLLPLALPGIFTGSMFVFVSVMGEMSASLILAGAGNVLIGNMLMNVIDTANFPLASAISSLVILFMVTLIAAGEVLFHISSLFAPFHR